MKERTKKVQKVLGEASRCFHIISRTALPGLPFEDIENDELLKTIKRFSQLYFTEIFGLCLMGNHHILLKMIPGKYYSDDAGAEFQLDTSNTESIM